MLRVPPPRFGGTHADGAYFVEVVAGAGHAFRALMLVVDADEDRLLRLREEQHRLLEQAAHDVLEHELAVDHFDEVVDGLELAGLDADLLRTGVDELLKLPVALAEFVQTPAVHGVAGQSDDGQIAEKCPPAQPESGGNADVESQRLRPDAVAVPGD